MMSDRIRLVVMGDSCVGKSAIVKRFLFGDFVLNHVPTVEGKVQLRMWYKQIRIDQYIYNVRNVPIINCFTLHFRSIQSRFRTRG